MHVVSLNFLDEKWNKKERAADSVRASCLNLIFKRLIYMYILWFYDFIRMYVLHIYYTYIHCTLCMFKAYVYIISILASEYVAGLNVWPCMVYWTEIYRCILMPYLYACSCYILHVNRIYAIINICFDAHYCRLDGAISYINSRPNA